MFHVLHRFWRWLLARLGYCGGAHFLAGAPSLSPRERQIMELRFGLADGIERTQKEAADALGISQSYISRLEKRIIHTLKVQLENE